MKLPNIYTSKNLKYFPAVPLILMLLAIYFSTHIRLDSSLSGGATITIQTNTTKSPQELSGLISSALHVPTPTVTANPGAITITIAANQSISNAYDYLLAFYSNQTQYNTYLVNATSASVGLQASPGNQTLAGELSVADAGLNRTMSGMNSALASELGSLSQFITPPSYNKADAASMSSAAQNAYSNASLAYQQDVIRQLHTVIPFTTAPSYTPITVQQSKVFLSSLVQIIIMAFVFVSIVVFVIFRTIVPSLAVIFGAANDMVIALGAMGLLGIPLGIASIGGLLMLLGYSIDTDLLTSIRILKRHEGTPEERAYGSMKTGLTMTSAAIVSFATLFLVSFVAYVPTYYEISGVVLFGLLEDLATTWLGNASFILMYIKRKERR